MEIEIPKCLLAAAHNMLNTLPVDPTWLLGHTNCCAVFTDVVLHQSSRDQIWHGRACRDLVQCARITDLFVIRDIIAF